MNFKTLSPLMLLIKTFTSLKVISIFLLLLLSLNTSAQSWIQVDDFPSTERDDGVVFVIDDKAYCGTGFKVGWTETRDFHSLDMNSDTWTTISALPVGKERQYAAGFSTLTHGFVFGGLNNSQYLNDLWMYNTYVDAWIEKSALPSFGRRGSASFVISGIAYIVGGNSLTDAAISEVWAYDASTDQWEQKNNFPFGSIYRASASATNDKGYLIFGKDKNDNFNNTLYEYNPVSDTWAKKSEFPGPGRMHSSLSYIANQLFIVAGEDSLGNYFNDLWSFNLNNSTWEERTPLPGVKRRGGMCFNNDSAIYYTTGIDSHNTRLKETWKHTHPLNINEENQLININLFPNPARFSIRIEIDSFNANHNYQLRIIDNQGKEYIEQSINTKSAEIAINQLDKGVYFVCIQRKDTLQYLKFIKQ